MGLNRDTDVMYIVVKNNSYHATPTYEIAMMLCNIEAYTYVGRYLKDELQTPDAIPVCACPGNPIASPIQNICGTCHLRQRTADDPPNFAREIMQQIADGANAAHASRAPASDPNAKTCEFCDVLHPAVHCAKKDPTRTHCDECGQRLVSASRSNAYGCDGMAKLGKVRGFLASFAMGETGDEQAFEWQDFYESLKREAQAVLEETGMRAPCSASAFPHCKGCLNQFDAEAECTANGCRMYDDGGDPVMVKSDE